MKQEKNWQHKSLDSLEKINTASPGSKDDVSTIVYRSYELRRKQVGSFTIDDIRFMIIQGEGLPFMISLAIEELKVNILAEGNYYEGDLLMSLLKVDSAFWQENQQLAEKVRSLYRDNIEQIQYAEIPNTTKREFETCFTQNLLNV